MRRLQFYLERSLPFYFYGRLKARFGVAKKIYPREIDCHGVRLGIKGLPSILKDYMMDGRYEKAEVTLLAKHLTGKESVLEIGSAIGLVGIYCKSIWKIQSLVGVEPNPNTVARLRENYALNGVIPELIEAAISDKDGVVRLHASDMFWTDSLFPSEDHGGGRVIDVPSYTLSSLVKRCGFNVDTIIMDVEGAEQFVKAVEIPSSVNLLIVELHPHLVGARAAFGFLAEVIRSGFSVDDQMGDVWLLRRAVSR